MLHDKFLPIFQEIQNERDSQDLKFGIKNYKMVDRFFFSKETLIALSEKYKRFNKTATKPSWLNILLEEIYEAFSETKIDKQRSELIQVAAVTIAVIEYLDRKIIGKTCEVFLETEPENQRQQMVRVAATAVALIEYLDRRIGNV